MHRLVQLVALAALVSAPAAHAHGHWGPPAGFLVGISVGPTWGEYRGATVDVEFDFGRHGQYFGIDLEGGGGVNGAPNGVLLETVALGWRGMFLHGPVKPTVFVGGFTGLEQEFGRSGAYGYILAGARAFVGVAFFFGHRFSVGGEIGGTAGFRQQLSGPYWDYSGFTSSFEARFRLTF